MSYMIKRLLRDLEQYRVSNSRTGHMATADVIGLSTANLLSLVMSDVWMLGRDVMLLLERERARSEGESLEPISDVQLQSLSERIDGLLNAGNHWMSGPR